MRTSSLSGLSTYGIVVMFIGDGTWWSFGLTYNVIDEMRYTIVS